MATDAGRAGGVQVRYRSQRGITAGFAPSHIFASKFTRYWIGAVHCQESEVMSSFELEVIYEGRALTVFGVVVPGRGCLASAWLDGLPLQPQAQFRARLDRLTEVGFLRSPEEMRPLQCNGEPPVHEIKTRSGHRLYVIRSRQDWVATHGAVKPSDRKVCAQAERARGIWKEAQEQ